MPAVYVDHSNLLSIQLAVQQLAMANDGSVVIAGSQLNELPTATQLAGNTPFLVTGFPSLPQFTAGGRPIAAGGTRPAGISEPNWDVPQALLWPHVPEQNETHWSDAVAAMVAMLWTFTYHVDLDLSAQIASISGDVITLATGQPAPPDAVDTGLTLTGGAHAEEQLSLASVSGQVVTTTTAAVYTDHTTMSWPTCFYCDLPEGDRGFRKSYYRFGDSSELDWLSLSWIICAKEMLTAQYVPNP